MRKILTIFAVTMLICSAAANAQKTWTGATSTAWNTSTNWSPAGAPASTDDVIIPSAPVNQPVVSGTSTPICKNLTINSGASLSISATATNNALLTASGNAIINGALTIGGAVTKTGKLVVVNVTWGSTGSMSGFLNGSIETSGTWEFSTGSAISMGLCTVTFTGSTTTQIISKSSISSFSNVTISKTGSQAVQISTTSTSTLKFGGSVTISTGATLVGPANITTIFSGNLNNSGHFSFTNGTQSFEKTSGTQTIQVNSGDVFYNLTINAGGMVTINNTLTVQDNVIIQAGVFDPLGNAVIVFGDWANAVGDAGFVEGTSRVIFSGGNYHQYCSNETFYTLEVNKTIGGALRVNGATVTCSLYDWTAGSVDVLGNGTFTALDLADNGIRGNYYVNTGCTINLYQDNFQYVDLGGNLTFTNGGTINVYGGMGWSQWPNYANASITMNGGTLDFKDQGISVNAGGTYTITATITGGTIRTSGGFYCDRADFAMTGGTLEFYGSNDVNLSMSAGTLKHILVNKSSTDNRGSTVNLVTNLTTTGNITTQTGTFSTVNKIINLGGHVYINNGGVFLLGANAQLKMSSEMSVNVNEGGILKTYGAPADQAAITHSTGYYYLFVNNGGTISAKYTTFSYTHNIVVGMGSIIDPANAFYHCTFAYGGSGSYLLGIDNTQDVSIHEANFPTLPPVKSVSKISNVGRVNFKDATGIYSGPAWEWDPYNRIDWGVSAPGFWTGEVSSDWSTASNWDNYDVPDMYTDVIIPAGTPFSPIISSGTQDCLDMEVLAGATLTINGGALHVFGDFDVEQGQFTMNGTTGLYFRGLTDSQWLSGPASIYSNIRVLKDDPNKEVYLYFSHEVTTNGNIVIKEGGLKLYEDINILNTGDEAFMVEDGGFLEAEEITVPGTVHFQDGSDVVDVYRISCGGNFIADPGSSFHLIHLKMNGSGNQYFNDLTGMSLSLISIVIEKSSGTCYLQSDLDVESVIINSGILSCNNGPAPTNTYNIYTQQWYNNVGTNGFEASTGKVQFINQIFGFNGFCWGNTNFNILECNIEDDDFPTDVLFIEDGSVVCNAYDWISGKIQVNEDASFTANDLLDNAIKGSFTCEEGATINLTNSGSGTFVDLAGELHNFGGTINISGSLCYWPYNGNAVVEMTAGTIDIKTCDLNIHSNGWSLNDNITGGNIRLARNYIGSRADFTPSAGTLVFYGASDATMAQSNGSKVFNVAIEKTSTDGEDASIAIPEWDERTGERISDGSRANTVKLNTDFTIDGYLAIDAGSLTLNGHTLNVTNSFNVNSTLNMTNAADVLYLGEGSNLWFHNGSTGNISTGVIYLHDWLLLESGCNFTASNGNTVSIIGDVDISGIECDEPGALFGNIVIDKTGFPFTWTNLNGSITANGNVTIEDESLVFISGGKILNNGILTVNGTMTVEDYFSNPGEVEIYNWFQLNGGLMINDGGSVLLHGHLDILEDGSLNINGGSFTSDEPSHTDFEHILGNLTMTSGLMEMKYTGLIFYPTSSSSISGGTIIIGASFRAEYPGKFQPSGGTLVFTAVNPLGYYIQLSGNNYAYNVVINNESEIFKVIDDLHIKNDLTIQNGKFIPQTNDVYIGGNWNNLVGPDGFIEGNASVVFTGTQNQYCSTEEFNILEIDKNGGYLHDMPGASISCQVYDWTRQGIDLDGGGSFYAADLADNGIYGQLMVTGSTIELHQDPSQSVDVFGSFGINGNGEILIYGGNDISHWGTTGDAGIGMYSGVLDFVDQGIHIFENPPFSVGCNIHGGTIRAKSFIAQSPCFDPSGGTVEIYGNDNGMVQAENGASFYNLKINKAPLPITTTMLTTKVENNLVIEEGTTIIPFGTTVQLYNVDVNDGGDFRVISATVMLEGWGHFNVNDGGYVNFEGYEGAMSKLTGQTATEEYLFNVNAGGTFYPVYTIFEQMDVFGINIASGAILSQWQTFKNCEFRKGLSGAYPLLTINNDQDLFIENAVFPANTWGGQYNVMKNVNAGQVFFSNATGAFAGEAFEQDPFNRIFWTGQPDEQSITLPAGWSGLSTWLLPSPENDVADLFAPIQTDFTILMNNSGGMYYPASGINTIDKWASQSAFRVKMENEATLMLDGGWELNKTFGMTAGWNLMPVIFNDVWDAPLAAQQLGAKLVIIKEVAGTKVFWPQFGIQTLYWLQPGNAYYVKLNSAGSLTFPPNDVKSGFKNMVSEENIHGPWGRVVPSAATHIIAFPATFFRGMATGDVIGVFTMDGSCAGFTKVTDLSQSIAVTAFGDDPTTPLKDGFDDGEPLTFGLFRNSSGEILKLETHYDSTLPDGGYFTMDGLSAIGYLKVSAESIGVTATDIHVYPNPTDGIVTIKSNCSIQSIRIINSEGIEVFSSGNILSGSAELDFTLLAPGMYQVLIVEQDRAVVRKIIRK